MDSFLSLVAADLFARYGNDLSRVAVVFPNKRASLFFNDHLVAQSLQPVWAPAYCTISDLVMGHSSLQIADPVKLVCELYRIFRTETGSTETLDDFYFWGELLIADFDDLDKNRVDAARLFENLADLKRIMDVPDYLTTEQEEAIRQFFHHFSIERRTELKERFISLWNVLGKVYTGFRQRLETLNIGYEGMVYRRFIDELDASNMEYECYVFVGFNVLNKVEHTLFSTLQEAGKALFYWDYDTFYTENPRHEAGEFINRNLRDFPSPLDKSLFSHLAMPKKVRCISATTENAQARYMAEWTAACPEGPERDNAIVLCNESLLLPVYHALSPDVRHLNVTMGFPLQQTPVVSFLQVLLELHLQGYDPENGCFRMAQVLAVLRHSYFKQLSSLSDTLATELQHTLRLFPLPSELQKDEVSTLIFTPQPTHAGLLACLMEILRRVAGLYRETNGPETTPSATGKPEEDAFFNQLYREALFKAYTTLQRIQDLVTEGDLLVENRTLATLLSRLLSSLSVPFHGEPAIGLQVMGVLETRNLDFRRIAILSLGEGLLPKAVDTASFVPHNLRKAFGMTTVEHKNAVYAYYFYRLLQRAEDITLLYNNFSDGLNAREWSRFLIQFLVEWTHPVERYHLQPSQMLKAIQPISVEKAGAVHARMLRNYDTRYRPEARLSPSALNCYMECSLRFYLKYVADLEAPEEVTADIDAALFGTIFHAVAERLYKGLSENSQRMVTREAVEQVLKSKTTLELLLDEVFNEELFKPRPGERPAYNGLQLIHRKVIGRYIKRLLEYDVRHTPFLFEGAEEKVRENITVYPTDGGEPLSLCVGGIIDRLDRREGVLHVIDYKTGGTPQTATNVESLFLPAEKRSGYIFQTFLYTALMQEKERKEGRTESVVPSLLHIHKAASESYSPVVEMGEPRKKQPVTNFSEYEEEFRERLHNLLREIFDPTVPFAQTDILSKCEYCDFKALCGR